MTPTCPFDIQRDMYSVHEQSKVMEHPSKFTCDFCGKSFISEYYLDTHFEKRHREHTQVSQIVANFVDTLS